jgi:hypothetical protein
MLKQVGLAVILSTLFLSSAMAAINQEKMSELYKFLPQKSGSYKSESGDCTVNIEKAKDGNSLKVSILENKEIDFTINMSDSSASIEREEVEEEIWASYTVASESPGFFSEVAGIIAVMWISIDEDRKAAIELRKMIDNSAKTAKCTIQL